MFKLETKNNKHRYIDTNTNNDIEITLNLDPILDCNFKYSNEYLINNFALLKYALKDIKKKYNNIVYVSKYYNKNFYNKLMNLDFKIQLYDCQIPFRKTSDINKLQDTKQIKEAKEYILAKLNKKAKINAEHLYNKFEEYTEKIFDIEKGKYIIKTIEEKNKIKGAVEYFVTDKVYIRNVYADNNKYLKVILNSLLNYQLDITLSCMYTDKQLLNIIKELNGEIKYTYFIWKKEE